MKQALSRLWSRLWLRGVQFSGAYGRLDQLYRVSDPWDLASPREHARFAATNALLESLVPHPASLLEVGCGEGAQTAWLARLCPNITGVDVSARAVARARKALPQVRFLAAPAERLPAVLAGETFDCVLACEVLYYAEDPGAVIASLQQLGECLLVTVYDQRMAPLRDLLGGPGWRACDAIEAEGTRWECFVWERAA